MAKAEKAKVFMNGRSQAVRIPLAYRFEGNEVDIRRDEVTGDVILSQPKRFTREQWVAFFARLDEIDIPEDFMADRDQGQYPVRVEL